MFVCVLTGIVSQRSVILLGRHPSSQTRRDEWEEIQEEALSLLPSLSVIIIAYYSMRKHDQAVCVTSLMWLKTWKWPRKPLWKPIHVSVWPYILPKWPSPLGTIVCVPEGSIPTFIDSNCLPKPVTSNLVTWPLASPGQWPVKTWPGHGLAIDPFHAILHPSLPVCALASAAVPLYTCILVCLVS